MSYNGEFMYDLAMSEEDNPPIAGFLCVLIVAGLACVGLLVWLILQLIALL